MRKAFVGRILLFPVVLLSLLWYACGGSGSGDDDSAEGDFAAATRVPANDVAVPVPGDGEEALAGGDDAQTADIGRKIVRTANVSLVIDDLDDALSNVRSVARGAGGFVADSDIVVNNAEDEQVAKPERAMITIRVPAESFEDVMEQFRSDARGVDSEESNVGEVTAEYTDLEARLRNLEAAEAQYVGLLQRAASIEEIIRVQEKVDSVRLQVEQVQGRLNVLDNQTELATITVSLRLFAPPVVRAADNSHWAVQAFETSAEASTAMIVVLGSVAIAALFVSAWVIPPTLVAFVVWRKFGPMIAAVAKRLG